MRRKVWVLAVGVPCTLCAQTSAYQSADCNTSIFLANAKASLIFNVSSTQFDLGYLHEGSGKSWLYGLDVTGKPTSEFSTLFVKGKTPPAAGGSAAFGYHHPISKDIDHQVASTRLRDDWALLQFTYTRQSSFETVPNSTTEPEKRTFDGYRAVAVYNALVNAPGSTLLLGVAAGIQRQNNLDQLKPVTISTPVAASVPGIAPFTVTQQASSGYFGDYKKYFGAPLYTDAIWIPKGLPWIDFDAFTRWNAAHEYRYIEGGIGIFLAKPGNATQVLGGISLAWKNGTPTLGFVAGWSF
jgi:hypothetical protein